MPGPYTAFTFGDPTPVPAHISEVAINLLGPMYSISNIGPVPVGDELQCATVGTPYSESVDAQGGYSPYTYEVTSGALPDGLSLDPDTGEISGTPTVAGSFTFTVKVTDYHASVGSHAFTIVVSPPPSSNSGFVA